jgi:hypothetical protein
VTQHLSCLQGASPSSTPASQSAQDELIKAANSAEKALEQQARKAARKRFVPAVLVADLLVTSHVRTWTALTTTTWSYIQ